MAFPGMIFLTTQVDDRCPPASDPTAFAEILAARLLHDVGRGPKRRRAVAAVKATQEYANRNACPSHALPVTPDPDDPELSKRAWESCVQRWRAQLQDVQSTVEARGRSCPKVFDDSDLCQQSPQVVKSFLDPAALDIVTHTRHGASKYILAQSRAFLDSTRT